MNEPTWIELDDCHAVHEELLKRFGGSEGVREAGLLESALERPKNLLAYGEPSLFDLAACYAMGIVKNHPFVDGNKRTGFVAAALFLECNGYRLEAPEEHAVLQTLALASGEITERDYSLWLADASVEIPKA